ncbi:MAG TPA: PAS domain S-box protein [Victivallales bacterium]|nr:PAS domain S-box protein [Victivallales bacterium]
MKFFPDKLRFYRKKERLSTNDFCKLAEIGSTSLWKLENGKKEPTESEARMFAYLLHISVSEISDLEDLSISKNSLSSSILDSWSSFVDADERKIIEQANDFVSKIRLQQHELKQASIVIKALLSSMQTIFYVKDINMKYITANAAFLKILDLDSKYKVAGKVDEDFFSSKDAKENNMLDYNVLVSGEPIIKQEGYIPGTRKKKWGLFSKLPVLDSEGKIAAIVATIVDITKRKKAEEIRRLLEVTLNNSSDVVWLRHPPPDNKLIYVSDSIDALSGYPKNNFMSKGNFWIDVCVHPEDRKLQEEYRKNKSWPTVRVYRIVKPDGNIRWIESTIFYNKYNDQRCIGTIDRDITADKVNEENRTENVEKAVKNIKSDIVRILEKNGISEEVIEEINKC